MEVERAFRTLKSTLSLRPVCHPLVSNASCTTTGAAKSLQLVIPEMATIGFMAESVRIPTSTGSLIILVMNFQEEFNKKPIRIEIKGGSLLFDLAAYKPGP